MFDPKLFAIVLSVVLMCQAGVAAAADKAPGAVDGRSAKSAAIDSVATQPAATIATPKLQAAKQHKLKKPKANKGREPSTVPELDGALASLSLLLLGGLVAVTREMRSVKA